MWICGTCGEDSEDDYSVCWNCGTDRNAPAAIDDSSQIGSRDAELNPIAAATEDHGVGAGASLAPAVDHCQGRTPGSARTSRVLKIHHYKNTRASFLNLESVVLLRREIAGDRKRSAVWKVFTTSPELALAVSEEEARRILQAMGYAGSMDD
jgi:hypothetical protein